MPHPLVAILAAAGALGAAGGSSPAGLAGLAAPLGDAVPDLVEEVDYDLPPIEPRQVLVGALVVLGGLLLARGLRMVLHWWLRRRRSPSYAEVFSRLAAWALGALALAAGLTVAFPSVQPVDVLGGLGIASLALGIAFQNVLSNLFAGVLILVREPFRSGDQIAVCDVRGTVEEVNLRETVVRTFDGRRVLVPNATVHGEVLVVQTGYERIRTSVCLGVDYATDPQHARTTALDAVRRVEGVAADPAPDCLLTQLGPSTLDLELRFWSGARQLETLETRDRVIEAVLGAFAREGIAMPPETRQLEAGDSLQALLSPDGRRGDGRARHRT